MAMIDLKDVAVSGLESAIRMFTADLESLPEEAYTKKFGEKTRTVADIVYEVNMVNDHIGMTIRGEEPFPWPEGGWIVAPEDFASKAVVMQAFQASAEQFLETAKGFSLEDLEATVATEWGDLTKFSRCRFVAWHLGYHSGQLNFIQTLVGDDGWHW